MSLRGCAAVWGEVRGKGVCAGGYCRGGVNLWLIVELAGGARCVLFIDG